MIWQLASLLILAFAASGVKADDPVSQPLCTYNANLTTLTCYNLQSDNREYIIDYTHNNATLATGATVEIYDSMISDLPTDSFYYMTAASYLKFYNCRFNQFPSDAMTTFTAPRSIEVYDSFIGVLNPTYMSATYTKAYLYNITIARTQLNDIPALTFNTMAAITNIVLANNTIRTIQSQAFVTLAALLSLDLSGNQIEAIALGNFVAPLLTSLYLHDNNLMVVANSTFLTASMPKLSELTLANNPFICNCDLQWLKLYIAENSISLDDTSCVCPEKEGFNDLDFCSWSCA